MNQKEQILKQAEALFMKFGFKSITMDDVARELGVSKKTLYQYFSDKNDLVDQCVTAHLTEMEDCCKSAHNKNQNAVEKMVEITQMLSESIRQVNPSAMFDLKKYFKPSWDKLDTHRRSFVHEYTVANIKQGKKEGIYHQDIDANHISLIYIHLINLLTDPDNFPNNLDYSQMHIELVSYHMRSVCNQKGLEILKTKLKAS